MRPFELLTAAAQDVRFATRMLRRNAGFTAVAVLTLGLGIGAGTAVFSVVESVLLRQPPLGDPDRLVMLWLDDHEHGFPRDDWSYARFADTRLLSTSLAGAAAFERQSFVLTGSEEPEQLNGAAASASLFSVLGVHAALGRTFVDGEDVPGNDRVVVLSHALWVRRFGADPAVVGRRLQLNSQPHVVVGVMPASFAFPERRQELWVPLALDAARRANRDAIWLSVVARLRPGTSLTRATAELNGLGRRFGEQYPRTDVRAGTILVQLRDQAAEPVRSGLLVLSAAVLLVLLVACANVAGLQLARAAGRDRELAARLALGAGPGRLVRLLLAESVTLAALGGALGLLLAAWGVRGLLALAPAELEPLHGVRLDLGAALFALAAVVAASLAAGCYPALRLLRRPDLLSGLRQRTAGAAAGNSAYVEQPLTRDAITPGALRALGLPLLQGREFTAADGPKAPPVIIVNATLAKRFFPAGNAVGQRITYGRSEPDNPWLTIVGVVADSRRAEPGGRTWFESFLPEAQYARRSLMVMLRTTGDPLAMAAAVRLEVRRLDPGQPLSWVSTVERLLADRLAPRRFDATLLGLFAAAALLMSAVGLYGVMSYLVTLRTQELGVRMALGARRADVLGLIAGRAAALAAAGAAAGTLAALGLSRWLASLFYGVGALDPAAFTLAPVLLALAAAAAAAMPAWRATRVDPMSALRRE